MTDDVEKGKFDSMGRNYKPPKEKEPEGKPKKVAPIKDIKEVHKGDEEDVEKGSRPKIEEEPADRSTTSQKTDKRVKEEPVEKSKKAKLEPEEKEEDEPKDAPEEPESEEEEEEEEEEEVEKGFADRRPFESGGKQHTVHESAKESNAGGNKANKWAPATAARRRQEATTKRHRDEAEDEVIDENRYGSNAKRADQERTQGLKNLHKGGEGEEVEKGPATQTHRKKMIEESSSPRAGYGIIGRHGKEQRDEDRAASASPERKKQAMVGLKHLQKGETMEENEEVSQEYVTKAMVPIEEVDTIVKARTEEISKAYIVQIDEIKKAYDAKFVELNAKVDKMANETIVKGGQIVVIPQLMGLDGSGSMSNADALARMQAGR
jgi:hypothetical protein